MESLLNSFHDSKPSSTPKSFSSIHRQQSAPTLETISKLSKISSLSTQNDSIRLHYQLDLLQSENKHLRSKLKQSEEHFQKELKSREQVIFSISSMMQDRELQFKQLLESQENEKNLIIGQKESEKSVLLKKIKSVKSRLENFQAFETVQRLETEIEHLRNILKMTEKENRELVKRVEMGDKDLFRKKMIENEQSWNCVCFEVGMLLDELSKLRNMLGKMVKKDCGVEIVLKTLPGEREEVTKESLIKVLKEAVVMTRGIQGFCMDLYANNCGEVCDVQ